jgi:outer membrane protein OmpA-like peptidoglycan-associated protein
LYQEQELALEINLEQLVQKQIQLEKTYRKRSIQYPYAAPEQLDTLTVYSSLSGQLEIRMYPALEPVHLRLDNILFQPNQAEIQAVSLVELQRLAAFLKEHPNVQATIDVHTNGNCSYTFAQEITQERAQCIGDYLVYQEGIPQERILVRARGKDAPIQLNNTPEGRLENQRIEVFLTPLN